MTNPIMKEWVEKAEEDYKAANQLAKISLQHFATTICFHAQQCAEKYLKALIVSFDKDTQFPATLIVDLEALRKPIALPAQTFPEVNK